MKTFIITGLSVCLNLVGYGQSRFKIESLTTFAKVYGYVKYFHPSDEAARTNWDKFAVYGALKVERCETKEQLMQTLNELFNPIAPTVKFYNTGEHVAFDVKTITPPKARKYKPAYWQHNGVGYGMFNSGATYASIRVNRKGEMPVENDDERSPGFGNLMSYINAVPYRSARIKFTAKVRLKEGTSGTGHLWVRVDNANGSAGFFDNMASRPITGAGWKEYGIIGTVDQWADGLAFGCFLQGAGSLFVDEMKLCYEKDGKWIEIPLVDNSFESGKLNDQFSYGTWIARGDDYKIIITGEDHSEGKKCASISKKAVVKTMARLFEKFPVIGESINKPVGSGISCIVPLALYCNKDGTYPIANASNLYELLGNTNCEDMSLSLRHGDVVVAWNVFQHFYPYFDVVKVDWEGELEKALNKCYKDTGKIEHYYTLQELTAALKDGHVFIWQDDIMSNLRVPMIKWEFIENKLIITKVCGYNVDLNVGDIVTEVEGMSPRDYFDVIEKRISAATPGYMASMASYLSLAGPAGSELSIVANGKAMKLERILELFDEKCHKSLPMSGYEFKMLDTGIYYLNLDIIDMKQIDAHMPELVAAKAIICDLRGYPNGNHELIGHLMSRNDTDKWMHIPRFIYPDRENSAGYGHFGWSVKPIAPHISAKVIFITDGRAISYAESYMGYIEGYKLATIIGQPTAGTNGNVNSFMLPGGYYISFTGMRVLKHDGSTLHGVGILPDVYMSKTIQGVKEGRDEFLDKALEIARQP